MNSARSTESESVFLRILLTQWENKLHEKINDFECSDIMSGFISISKNYPSISYCVRNIYMACHCICRKIVWWYNMVYHTDVKTFMRNTDYKSIIIADYIF